LTAVKGFMRGWRGHAVLQVAARMKVYRDLAYVKKRKRMAVVTSLAGVVLLGASYFLVFTGGQSEMRALFAYVPLLAGIIMFHLGMQQVGKWNRAQRNDVILDTLLKDLGERYTLIHYLKIGGRTVEHAMVYPGGVLTITARELPGGVAFRDGRWRKINQGLSRFFGMGGAFLGNPSADATNDVKAVTGAVTEHQMDADVDAVVAFINPRVTIDVEEPDFPVTNGEGLVPYVVSLPAQPPLQPAERQRLVEVLTAEGTFETPQSAPTRRPVKRRAA
jgi:hypothetical protein